ncbi:MAG TPA: hypothetical protein VGC65_07835 [Bacteroidia bacterium]|jgi:hypothetical protein
MENKRNYILEAERIAIYLLPVSVQEAEKNKYADAMQKLNICFSDYETALWKNMMKSRWRMACIDAGLALREPGNNVRRKLFTMLAILEASPNYTKYFLSRNFSSLYIFKLAAIGIRAVCRAAIGAIMINNIKRRCS